MIGATKRSRRRAQRDRMKAHAEALLRAWGVGAFAHAHWERTVGIRGDTFTVCSCHACGNPRRWYKGKDRVTVAERREAEHGQE